MTRRIFRHVMVATLLLSTALVAVPRSAFATTLLTNTSAATENPYTGASASRYDWGFTTATTRTLSKITMGIPSGTSASNRYLALPGTGSNSATTPDSSANSITTTLDLRAELAASSWTPAASQVIAMKWGASGTFAYWFGINVTDGKLSFGRSPDGTTANFQQSSVAPGFVDGTTHWVRVTYQSDNGSGNHVTTFYTSSDGSSWTQLGTQYSSAGVATLADTTAVFNVGGSSGSDFNGKMYYAELRNGIAGTVVNAFDPTLASATSPSSWIASTGETWTVNRAGTILPADIQADITVANVSGVPVGGTANIRLIDGVATYNFSAASVTAGTVSEVDLSGFTNTSMPGSYASTITTYDNAGPPPVAVDSASASSLKFFPTFTPDLNTSSVSLSDSRLSQSGVQYAFLVSGVSTSTAIKCITVNFSTTADGAGPMPTGMSVTGATLDATSTWTNTPASWTAVGNNTNGTVTVSYATGETPVSSSAQTLVLDSLTNPSSAATYYATVNSYTTSNCISGAVDATRVAFSINNSLTATATIDPAMTFTVAGLNGSCNGFSNTIGANATGAAVPLGKVSLGTQAFGAQTLSLTTNAGGGFAVYVRSSSATSPVMIGLAHPADHIADVGAGAAPSATTEGFGYTTGDSGVAMTSGNVAPVPNASGNATVISAIGSVNSRSSCVGYLASVSKTTPPDTYQTVIIYTAVANF